MGRRMLWLDRESQSFSSRPWTFSLCPFWLLVLGFKTGHSQAPWHASSSSDTAHSMSWLLFHSYRFHHLEIHCNFFSICSHHSDSCLYYVFLQFLFSKQLFSKFFFLSFYYISFSPSISFSVYFFFLSFSPSLCFSFLSLFFLFILWQQGEANAILSSYYVEMLKYYIYSFNVFFD